MRYVAYYRVSTVQQGRSGLGLEAQQAAVRRFVDAQGGEVIESFRETVSGKRDDRPELAKALRRCRLTKATLVIAKLDRLSRSMRFLAEIRDSKVGFVACDMPEANTLTVGVMSAMAQYEREVISERTKAGLAAARARGVTLGHPRIHELVNADTVAARAEHIRQAHARNKDFAVLVAEIEEEAGEPLSLQAVANKLNAAGYTTARGKQWTRMQVKRVRSATVAAWTA